MSTVVDSGNVRRTRLRKVIKSSFAANGISVSDQFCQDLYTHFSSADAYILYPDVPPCLLQLSQAGITMGIISDFDERLDRIVQGLGIGSYIKFIVQSYVEGYSKPSKELYTAAKEHAGATVESWHIGDDPEKDAFTDTNVIIVDRENSITTNFERISTLEELPRLLDIL